MEAECCSPKVADVVMTCLVLDGEEKRMGMLLLGHILQTNIVMIRYGKPSEKSCKVGHKNTISTNKHCLLFGYIKQTSIAMTCLVVVFRIR